MSSLRIRDYVDADRAAVWQLHNAALIGTGAHAGNGPWDDDLNAIPAVYQQTDGAFLVGMLRGRIVAMGALKRTDERRAEIKRMRVAPEVQRRGFGRAILAALEQRAHALGYGLLHLDTTVQQTAAQALYEQHGYVEVGRTMLGPFEAVLYEKRLSQG
jgi:GNAT superfamily N-acetyltransferase